MHTVGSWIGSTKTQPRKQTSPRAMAWMGFGVLMGNGALDDSAMLLFA
jgi:hypothetical protein